MSKVVRPLTKRIVTCVLVLCLCCAQAGCIQQIFALPFQLLFFVLSLPFHILKIVIGLIPLAIKYAPLALLFVSTSEGDSEQIDGIMDTLNKDGHAYDMEVCQITPTIACIKLVRHTPPTNTESLAACFEEILNTQPNARVLFTDYDVQDCSPELLVEIWHHLKREHITAAVDERVMRALAAEIGSDRGRLS